MAEQLSDPSPCHCLGPPSQNLICVPNPSHPHRPRVLPQSTGQLMESRGTLALGKTLAQRKMLRVGGTTQPGGEVLLGLANP